MTAIAERIKMRNVEAILRGCAADPTFFAREIAGYPPWSGQSAIYRSTRKYRRTAVASGHANGKTNTLAVIVNEAMATMPQCRIVTSASGHDQVATTLWPEIHKVNANCKIKIGGELLTTQWKMPDGSFAQILSPDSATGLHGVHSAGPVIVILDEAESIPEDRMEAYNSLLASEGSFMVACFNPVLTSGYFYDQCNGGTEWNVIRLSCLDHPNVVTGTNIIPGGVTRQWVEEMRVKYCEDPANPDPEWFSRVLGQHPPQGSNALVAMAHLEAMNDVTPDVKVPRSMGVDVAEGGDDFSVLTVLDETRTVVACEDWRGDDPMVTTGRVLSAMSAHNVQPHNIGIDSIGIGSGVVARLREQGYGVTAVNFAETPKDDYHHLLGSDARFANRRQEIHRVLRELVRVKQIKVPPKFRKTRADITSILWATASDGKFTVEKKATFKERMKRSPDHGDSLLIALCASAPTRLEIF